MPSGHFICLLYSQKKNLYTVADTDFLFPKMSSCFEQGTARHLLTIATPPKCLPADSYCKKFQSHQDSMKLRSVRVNSLSYSSNSFKFGGLKYMGLNKVFDPNKNLIRYLLAPAGFFLKNLQLDIFQGKGLLTLFFFTKGFSN